MTAQSLGPVIPPSGVPARQHARSAAGRPLPLARTVPVPTAPEDVVYGIGRIDASGRIADRAVISALGWRGGDRLTGPPRPGRWSRAATRAAWSPCRPGRQLCPGLA